MSLLDKLRRIGHRASTLWHLHVEYPLHFYSPEHDPLGQRKLTRAIRDLGRKIYETRRWLQGARDVELAKDETRGEVKDCDLGLSVKFSGCVPVQGLGTLRGRSVYYRSRGEGWQFHVAREGCDDPLRDESWCYARRDYIFPDGGWVAPSVSIACILEAARAWVAEGAP